MGGCCSTPECSLDKDQLEAIADLVTNSEHFKAVNLAAAFIVPLKATENKNDLDKTVDAFSEDEKVINSYDEAKNHEGASDIAYGVKFALEQVNEKVAPVAETTMGPTLKKSDALKDAPAMVQDKAVEVAVGKAVESAVNEAVKKRVKEVMDAPAPAKEPVVEAAKVEEEAAKVEEEAPKVEEESAKVEEESANVEEEAAKVEEVEETA